MASTTIPKENVNADYSANKLIVKLKTMPDALQSAAQASALEALGLHNDVASTVNINLTGAEIWHLAGTISVPDAIAKYQASGLFDYVEPDYIIHLDSTESTGVESVATPADVIKPPADIAVASIPNDSGFTQLWGLNNTGQNSGVADADIDAPEAWDIQRGNPNMVVAVIDTGADITHPDLINNIYTNPREIAGDGIDNDSNGYVDDVHGWNFVARNNTPIDGQGHGTHVSGTIAGIGNNGIGVSGVAPNVKILPLKFLSDQGSGSLSDAILAINYATNMGIKITNNSWGGGGFSQALKDAIDAAGAHNSLFIAAAGNDGRNSDVSPAYPAAYNSTNIISVASTTRTDGISSFSNYGLTTVDLGAPGSEIYSTFPMAGSALGSQYGTISGTSMATPHVSGAAALVWSQNPSWTAAQVKDQLMRSVDPDAALAGKTVTAGRLNVNKALTVTGGNGDDFTSDINTVGVVAVAGNTTGTIEVASDTDWFKVNLVANHAYIIDEKGRSAGGTLTDTYIRGIYDSTGTLLPNTINDDFGGTYDSQVTFTPLATGNYFISAGAYSSGTGTYKVSVRENITNNTPVGTVTISGTPTQNEVLTATNNLTDADGLGAISYQWKADNAVIAGATSDILALTQAQVGKVISVAASYTDGHGIAESVASNPTTAVANVNDLPTGEVIIRSASGERLASADANGFSSTVKPDKAILPSPETGTAISTDIIKTLTVATTPKVGETLVADTATLVDLDGLGALSYQWKVTSGGTTSNISGATASTYTVASNDANKAISVAVSYTDGGTAVETKSSVLTSPAEVPAGFVIDTTLNGLQGNLAPFGEPGSATYGQTFNIPNAANLDSFSFWVNPEVAGTTILKAYLGEWDGHKVTGGRILWQSDAPTILATDAMQEVAFHGINQSIAANTQYVFFFSASGVFNGTPDNATFGADWNNPFRDGDAVWYNNSTLANLTDGSSWDGSPEWHPGLDLEFKASFGNANTRPTGNVTISDTTPDQNQVLTVTNNLVDADNIVGDIHYQWQANGVDIAGATSNTFTPVQALVNYRLSVVASYTDGKGVLETAVSATTTAVANVNDLPTGSVDITMATGQAVRAANNLLKGSDGQPLAGAALANAMNNAHADFKPLSAIDAPKVGDVLRAEAVSVQDIDGLGTFSYQWKITDGDTTTVIDGATTDTYTVAEADLGKTISATVSYTDGFQTPEHLDSDNTGTVGNSNAAPVLGGGNASTITIPATDSGWYDLTGSHDSSNTNYIAGDNEEGVTVFRNWMTFDLTSIPANIQSAQLQVKTYDYLSADSTETYQLNDVLTPVADLVVGGDGLTAIYDDLGAGVVYGSRDFSSADNRQTVAIELNAEAVADVVANAGSSFAMGGAITTLDADSSTNEYVFGNSHVGGTPADNIQLILTTAGGVSGLTYTENQVATPIASGITVADADNATLKSATVAITGHLDGDSVIPDYHEDILSFVSDNATMGNIVAEDYDAVHGTLALSSEGETATLAQWQAALRAVSYSNTSENPSDLQRTISYTINDSRDNSIPFVTTVDVVPVNDEPLRDADHLPTIVGTPISGRVLTANASRLSDADGFNPVDVSYEWYATPVVNGVDGDAVKIETPDAVDGNATYIVTNADQGKKISTHALYTDNGATPEHVDSALTIAVYGNSAATGAVTITGMVKQNSVLTADTSTIKDADGFAAGVPGTRFSYQWYTTEIAANSQPVAIQGATNKTYTPTQSQVGKKMSVAASFMDLDTPPTLESKTSLSTIAVVNVNDLPTGSVTITGNIAAGQTLTASNTLADVDGMGVVSYQWKAAGAAIVGAINSTYVISGAAIGKAITVEASYRDGGGTLEKVASAAAAAIIYGTPLNDANVSGTGTADIIDGLAGSDNIKGLAGNDYMYGRDGNDTLDSGLGLDTLEGGLGNDLYIVDVTGGVVDVIIEAVDAGVDTVSSSVSYSLASTQLENLTLTGTIATLATGNDFANILLGNASANTLVGAAGSDSLDGGAGNDSLDGGDDNDTLDGGAGIDRMNGGIGDDTFYVDVAGDAISENANAGTDTVISRVSYSLAETGLENLTLATGGIIATGNDFNNILTGNAVANTLVGAAGNDTLNGGAGIDRMNGGIGDDMFYVDVVGDVIGEDVNAGTDKVISSVSYSLVGTQLENLTLTGTTATLATGNNAANILEGNAQANLMVGGLGTDTLRGGAGNDTLDGGSGRDALSGGDGQDLFVLSNSYTVDSIFDFVSSDDKIQLKSVLFESLPRGALSVEMFKVGDSNVASDENDYVIYNSSTGALYYDDDGSLGDAAPVQIAILALVPVLNTSSFIIV